MSNNELLKPRYKVIALYPNSETNGMIMGKILIADFPTKSTQELWTEAKNEYPHIFKKLEWWEERGENDFDELKFVKTHAGNSVRTVLRLELRLNKIVLDGGKVRPISHWVPATEQEYNTFNAEIRNGQPIK